MANTSLPPCTVRVAMSIIAHEQTADERGFANYYAPGSSNSLAMVCHHIGKHIWQLGLHLLARLVSVAAFNEECLLLPETSIFVSSAHLEDVEEQNKETERQT